MGHHLVTIKARDELFMDYQRLTVINGCFFHRRRSSKYVKTDPVQWLVPQATWFMQLCTPNATLHAPRPKLHTRDLTLLTSHSTRYPDTSHSTLHTILYALNFPLYTPNSSLHTPHIGRATLHASHVRDFPDFSHVGATKSACSYKFLMNPKILPPQNRCFVRGFRQFSSHVTKCHVCHVICAVSPLHSARQCDSQKTRNTTRLKCCVCHAKWTWTPPKCCACHEKYNLCSENHAKVLRLSHKMTFEYFRHFLTRNVGDVWRCYVDEVKSWIWQQFFGKNPSQELSGKTLINHKNVRKKYIDYPIVFCWETNTQESAKEP